MPGLTFWNSLKRIIAWWGSFNPSHILPKLLLLPARGTLRQWCKPETPYWCNIPVHVTGYTLFILQHGTQPSVLYFRLLTSQFKFPRTHIPSLLSISILSCMLRFSFLTLLPSRLLLILLRIFQSPSSQSISFSFLPPVFYSFNSFLHFSFLPSLLPLWPILTGSNVMIPALRGILS